MKRRTWGVMLALVSGVSCADTVPLSSAKVPASEDGTVRLYGVHHATYAAFSSNEVPEPVAGFIGHQDVAVKVAEGYLLTSREGMEVIATNMQADPSVTLKHGDEKYAGAYVDFDGMFGTSLALIRADVPGTPIDLRSLQGPDEVAVLIGGARPSIAPVIGPRVACERNEETDVWLCDALEGAFPFTIAADAGHGPIALIVERNGYFHSPKHRQGVSVARARRFLDQYFASWGARLPKPVY